MNILLVGGAEAVGKSESIYRLTNFLLSRGYRDVTKSVPSTFADFRAVLEGQNQYGENIRIIVNTATDTVKIINDFKVSFDNNGSYNILISSIRDDNFWPRNDFFRIMQINPSKDFILEVPLGKITRKGSNFFIALNWYQQQLDNLLLNTISNSPFNL